jgi:hypothetical protein
MTGKCRLDFCDRDAYSRDHLCRAHAHQQRMGGPLRPIKTLIRDRGCDFPDCGRKHKARGLCASHLNQRERGVELRPIRPRGRFRDPQPEQGEGPLPAGWGRVARPKTVKRPVNDQALSSQQPVCPPTDPRTLAVVAAKLRDWGAEDCAEALGVTPDQIRVEAGRWLMWEGTAA